MGVTSNRHWMVTALLALFMAVFVLVPAADAAACASDMEPAHVASTLDRPVQPDDGPAGDHALCAHGHCHHGGVVLPQPTPAEAATLRLGGPTLTPTAAPAASHSPNGLMRPPRG